MTRFVEILHGRYYAALERLSGRRTLDTLPSQYRLGVDRLRMAYSDDYLTKQLHGVPDFDAIGRAIGTLSLAPDDALGSTEEERIVAIRRIVDLLKAQECPQPNRRS